MNILPGNLRFGAGQPVKRLEDQRLLTGKGQFIDDKPEDGALWLHVLRSPHAHAKIVSIDAGAAVAAVVASSRAEAQTAAEAPFPEPVAQDRDVVPAILVLFGRQPAPQSGTDSQHLKYAG